MNLTLKESQKLLSGNNANQNTGISKRVFGRIQVIPGITKYKYPARPKTGRTTKVVFCDYWQNFHLSDTPASVRKEEYRNANV